MQMNQIVDTSALSVAKLEKWAHASDHLPPTYRHSFQTLVDDIKHTQVSSLTGERDATTSLLLSMIIALKGELEHLEDQMALQQIRQYGS